MNDQLKKTKGTEGLKPNELVGKLKDLRSTERSYSLFMNSSTIYGGETYEMRNHVGYSPISFLTGHSYYSYKSAINTLPTFPRLSALHLSGVSSMVCQ